MGLVIPVEQKVRGKGESLATLSREGGELDGAAIGRHFPIASLSKRCLVTVGGSTCNSPDS